MSAKLDMNLLLRDMPVAPAKVWQFSQTTMVMGRARSGTPAQAVISRSMASCWGVAPVMVSWLGSPAVLVAGPEIVPAVNAAASSIAAVMVLRSLRVGVDSGLSGEVSCGSVFITLTVASRSEMSRSFSRGREN